MSSQGPEKSIVELMSMINVTHEIASIAIASDNKLSLQIHCNANTLSEQQSHELEILLSRLPGEWEKTLAKNSTIFSLSEKICQEMMKKDNLQSLSSIMPLGPVKKAPRRPLGAPTQEATIKPAQDEFPPTLADIVATQSEPEFGSFPPIQSSTSAPQKSATPPPRPVGGPPNSGAPPRPQGGPPISGAPPRPQGGPPIGGAPPRPNSTSPQELPSRARPIVHREKPIHLETVLLLSSSSINKNQVQYRAHHSDDEIQKMCQEAVNSANNNTNFLIPDSKFKNKIQQILEAIIIDKFKSIPDQAPTIEGKAVLNRRNSPKSSL